MLIRTDAVIKGFTSILFIVNLLLPDERVILLYSIV